MNEPDVNKADICVGVDLELYAKIRRLALDMGASFANLARAGLHLAYCNVKLKPEDFKWIEERRKLNKVKREAKRRWRKK